MSSSTISNPGTVFTDDTPVISDGTNAPPPGAIGSIGTGLPDDNTFTSVYTPPTNNNDPNQIAVTSTATIVLVSLGIAVGVLFLLGVAGMYYIAHKNKRAAEKEALEIAAEGGVGREGGGGGGGEGGRRGLTEKLNGQEEEENLSRSSRTAGFLLEVDTEKQQPMVPDFSDNASSSVASSSSWRYRGVDEEVSRVSGNHQQQQQQIDLSDPHGGSRPFMSSVTSLNSTSVASDLQQQTATTTATTATTTSQEYTKGHRSKPSLVDVAKVYSHRMSMVNPLVMVGGASQNSGRHPQQQQQQQQPQDMIHSAVSDNGYHALPLGMESEYIGHGINNYHHHHHHSVPDDQQQHFDDYNSNPFASPPLSAGSEVSFGGSSSTSSQRGGFDSSLQNSERRGSLAMTAAMEGFNNRSVGSLSDTGSGSGINEQSSYNNNNSNNNNRWSRQVSSQQHPQQYHPIAMTSPVEISYQPPSRPTSPDISEGGNSLTSPITMTGGRESRPVSRLENASLVQQIQLQRRSSAVFQGQAKRSNDALNERGGGGRGGSGHSSRPMSVAVGNHSYGGHGGFGAAPGASGRPGDRFSAYQSYQRQISSQAQEGGQQEQEQQQQQQQQQQQSSSYRNSIHHNPYAGGETGVLREAATSASNSSSDSLNRINPAFPAAIPRQPLQQPKPRPKSSYKTDFE